MKRRIIASCLIAGVLLLSAVAVRVVSQESKQQKTAQVEGFIVAPGKREFSPALLQQLRAPTGFRVSVLPNRRATRA